MDLEARCLETEAQIGERRSLAVGAGDMDYRRQPLFGMAQSIQNALHTHEIKIDNLRMQGEQPRQYGVTHRHASVLNWARRERERPTLHRYCRCLLASRQAA